MANSLCRHDSSPVYPLSKHTAVLVERCSPALREGTQRLHLPMFVIPPTLILKSGNFNRVFANGNISDRAPQQIPIEQPLDLFLNGPAYTTFLHVGITARPVTPLASSSFNRPQGGNCNTTLNPGQKGVKNGTSCTV